MLDDADLVRLRDCAGRACAALPGAVLEQPFGPQTDAWKVGGKIFALVADRGVSLKAGDRETAAFMIEIGVARPAPYLKRGDWMQVAWAGIAGPAGGADDPGEGQLAEDDLADRLGISYRAVRAKLTRAVQAGLPDRAPD